MNKYILSIDQGTTSCRALLIDQSGKIGHVTQEEFTQYFPQNAWVEHDANEIWAVQLKLIKQLVDGFNISWQQVAAIGITNQRETTVVWDKTTGKPIYNAIVWQDRRTASICDRLKSEGHVDYIQENTGLVLDAYFSGTKLHWILENVPNAYQLAKENKLAFGTIDTWLAWNLSGGLLHITDPSNASRTMLYNIKTQAWDTQLLDILNIPTSVLPSVKQTSEIYGNTSASVLGAEIPICSLVGDQQSALFGQLCLDVGSVKNTYGTGSFMLMNTGQQCVQSTAGLLSTIAWKVNNEITYALEGSVYIAGAAIQWLRDGLKLIDDAPDSEFIAGKSEDSDGVIVVPAFAGLGAPYWDMYARGAVFGLTRRTNKSHFVRATLESLAYQTKDILQAMEQDSGIQLNLLRVDGGACKNNILMQFQADILGIPVERPEVFETTALGAAYLAGLAIDFWDIDSLKSKWKLDHRFGVKMDQKERERLYYNWTKAVERTFDWENVIK